MNHASTSCGTLTPDTNLLVTSQENSRMLHAIVKAG